MALVKAGSSLSSSRITSRGSVRDDASPSASRGLRYSSIICLPSLVELLYQYTMCWSRRELCPTCAYDNNSLTYHSTVLPDLSIVDYHTVSTIFLDIVFGRHGSEEFTSSSVGPNQMREHDGQRFY